MMKKEKIVPEEKPEQIRSYAIQVKGEATTAWRAPVPGRIEDEESIMTIDHLLEKGDKEINRLENLITATQIELLCQKGDTLAAMEVLEKRKKIERDYKSPLNVFQRDRQDSGAIYQGAHAFVGAFRDSAGYMFELYYKKAADRGVKAASRHLRKFVRVSPYHIFFYRDGKKILKPDFIGDQQPTEDVPGFAKYETLEPPFTFSFTLFILPVGPFKDFLKDKDRVLEALYASTLAGQGGCRSANYGGWKILSATVVPWNIRTT